MQLINAAKVVNQQCFCFFYILQRISPYSVIKYDVNEEKPLRDSAGFCIEAAKGALVPGPRTQRRFFPQGIFCLFLLEVSVMQLHHKRTGFHLCQSTALRLTFNDSPKMTSPVLPFHR